MTLAPEEKAERARDRLLETVVKKGPTKYISKVLAPIFQRMIRAEAAADDRQYHTAVVDGEIRQVERNIGQCVCVTCGKVCKWDGGIEVLHAGHFVTSRRNSILFEEDNIFPQCSQCNFFLSGNPQAFTQWMLAVKGKDTVERLERLKTQSVSFTRDQLVDMRISYAARLKAAKERMKD